MATARVNGVNLYYEETGSGFPLIWCHEFGGDYRSWEPQVRYFSRRYRVITWNYRGYPPSEVPEDPAAYRNDILVEDLAALMRHLGIERAHVGGLSMGGNVALNFGIAHPDMSESLIICGCGSGTVGRETFLAEGEKRAQEFLAEGIEAKVRNFAGLASRRGFAEKDPRGWAEFLQQVRDHSPVGSAHMLRGVQMKRKTIFELEPESGGSRCPHSACSSSHFGPGGGHGRSGFDALPRAQPVHEAATSPLRSCRTRQLAAPCPKGRAPRRSTPLLAAIIGPGAR